MNWGCVWIFPNLYFDVLILVHTSLGNTVQHDFDTKLFFWVSLADLILWFFAFLVIWFYWTTDFFNCWDLFFYCIYTAIFSESFMSWVLSDVILVAIWFIEILFVFSTQLLWLISLCIKSSVDFNYELVKSPIIVGTFFMIWSFDFTNVRKLGLPPETYNAFSRVLHKRPLRFFWKKLKTILE